MVSTGDLLGERVIDAAVGRGTLTVDVEVATVLLPVCLVLEAQSHTLVTLTRLLVTLCLVELACRGKGTTRLCVSTEPATVPAWGGEAGHSLPLPALMSGGQLTADDHSVILDCVVIVVHIGAAALVKEFLVAAIMGMAAPGGGRGERAQATS